MQLLYVNEVTHKRIKALAIHERRTIGAYLDVMAEQQMRQFSAKQRNEMYARLDDPRIIGGGRPDAA